MLKPIYLKSFEKDLKRDSKRGKDIDKMRKVMKLLIEEKALPDKFRNHKLKGNFVGYWECHVEPDWLLVYKKTQTEIIFVSTGTHSDLF